MIFSDIIDYNLKVDDFKVDDVRKTQLTILKWLLAVDVVVIILTFVVSDTPLPFTYGVVFGSAISGLSLWELGVTLTRAVHMPPEKAQGYAVKKFIIRYIVYGVVLYVSILAPYINVLGTILGMSIIKFIILATNLFNDKQYYKNIIKRKEDESSGR